MKVLHVIATSPLDSMGVTTALRAIAGAQAAIGMDVRIVAQGGWPIGPSDRVPVVECGARDLPRVLDRLADGKTIIHTHVPWRLPALAPLYVARRDRRFVHSPHGSLAPAALATRGRRKKLAWAALFRRAIRSHDLLVVNSAAEQADVEHLRLGRPVACIPHPLELPEPRARGSRHPRTVAFLGRIHPIKGVLELVRAWRSLGPEAAGWTLKIAGPVEDGEYMAAVQAAADGDPTIELLPPVYGDDRWRFLADACLVAVPSKSENFCYIVAEALAVGTPVLTTTGVPWPAIDEHRLGWRGQGTVTGLREQLGRALRTSPTALTAMGSRGRLHIEAELGYVAVARGYERAYGPGF